MYARIVYLVHVRPEETIDFHVRYAWAGIARLYGQLAASRGTTMAMGQALLNIEKGGTPSTQLGPRMGMEKTSLSRLLNNLEAHGLIERRADDADRRVVRVQLPQVLGIVVLPHARQDLVVEAITHLHQFLRRPRRGSHHVWFRRALA